MQQVKGGEASVKTHTTGRRVTGVPETGVTEVTLAGEGPSYEVSPRILHNLRFIPISQVSVL